MKIVLVIVVSLICATHVLAADKIARPVGVRGVGRIKAEILPKVEVAQVIKQGNEFLVIY